MRARLREQGFTLIEVLVALAPTPAVVLASIAASVPNPALALLLAKHWQRLLQVQQSLERDYLRMRQLEARYRMLFERSTEPVMIVEAGTLRIREANPAAHTLVGARPASLAGKKILTFIDKSSHDAVQSLVGAALVLAAGSGAAGAGGRHVAGRGLRSGNRRGDHGAAESAPSRCTARPSDRRWQRG